MQPAPKSALASGATRRAENSYVTFLGNPTCKLLVVGPADNVGGFTFEMDFDGRRSDCGCVEPVWGASDRSNWV